MKFIPYSRQFIDEQDRKLVSKSLLGDLITTGPFVEKFELNVKKYLSCKYSYVCSSGTAAIHLAMLSLSLKKNDVILMPSVNFIASFNIAKMFSSFRVRKNFLHSGPEIILLTQNHQNFSINQKIWYIEIKIFSQFRVEKINSRPEQRKCFLTLT